MIERIGDKLYVKRKGYDIFLNSLVDKKDIILISEYFAEQQSSGVRVKVELDLSNCATKADLKNLTGVDTSKFAKNGDLASLKSEVDKLDIDKLEKLPTVLNSLKNKVDKLDVNKQIPVPVDVNKVNYLVKMILLKKMYIMLRTKILKMKYLILLT